MGLSSSQARLLNLTARMHQIEYGAQRIEAMKLQMANESRRVYEDYLDALDKTKIQLKTITTNGAVTFVDLSSYEQFLEAGFALVVNGLPSDFTFAGGSSTPRINSAGLFAGGGAYSGGISGGIFSGGAASTVAPSHYTNVTSMNMGGISTLTGGSFTSIMSNVGSGGFIVPPGGRTSSLITSLPGSTFPTASSSGSDMPSPNPEPTPSVSSGSSVICRSADDLIEAIKALFKDENGNPLDISSAMIDNFETLLTNLLNSGSITILEKPQGADDFPEVGTLEFADHETSVATNTKLQEVSDEVELRKAEAKYEADMKRIDMKDRRYDTELAALDNERNAVKLEMETLKTVAKDNVDRTFRLFG